MHLQFYTDGGVNFHTNVSKTITNIYTGYNLFVGSGVSKPMSMLIFLVYTIYRCSGVSDSFP